MGSSILDGEKISDIPVLKNRTTHKKGVLQTI